MGKYSANFERLPQGNGKKEGTVLKVTVKTAQYVSGAVYQNGYPVLALFGAGENAEILLKRKDKSLIGLAVLKVRGHTIDSKGFGYDDSFIIY